MTGFDRLVADYRRDDIATLVRRPDVADVVRRAQHLRRRQVAGGVASAALVVSAAVVGVQAVGSSDAPIHLSPAAGAPHFLAATHIDLPVSFGVAGRDALWLVGRRGEQWQLAKVTAPDVTIALRVPLDGLPIAVAATKRFVWVAATTPSGGQLAQFDTDTGAALGTYPLAAAPVAVNATDDGFAWVTENVGGAVAVTRVDGVKRSVGWVSAPVAGSPGQPTVVLGKPRLYVHTRVGNDTRVAALSMTDGKLAKWSLDFGPSPVRDIAFTDPLFFAASEGPRVGFWTAAFVGTGPETTVTNLSTLPTYKVTTTQAHAWALSTDAHGTVLSSFDRADGVIGSTITTKVSATKVSVLVADTHYLWLVDGNHISVFGPS